MRLARDAKRLGRCRLKPLREGSFLSSDLGRWLALWCVRAAVVKMVSTRCMQLSNFAYQKWAPFYERCSAEWRAENAYYEDEDV